MNHSQKALLQAVVANACQGRPDESIQRLVRGGSLLAVAGQRRMGLCSRLTGPLQLGREHAATELGAMPGTLKDMASLLLLPETELEHRCFALAAVNALLPPPSQATSRKAQDLLAERGQGKRVVVVGHFPFLNNLAHDFARLSILELAPQPGDVGAQDAATVVPQAEVLAITGQTLVNGTLSGLLNLVRTGAYVMLLGPSVPFAPALLDMGISALGGAVVQHMDQAAADVLAGKPFKGLAGVESMLWEK